MKQIYPDLWQSEKGTHFGMRLNTYLLKTKEERIVVYYTNAEDEADVIKNMQPKYQFISHNHEFTPALFNNLNDFETTLCIHEKASKYLNKFVANKICIDKESDEIAGLQIFYTPGHTDNNICMYYKSPYGKNYLFTGDTIYLDNGKWNTLVMINEGGSYKDLKNSLLRLRELEVDVIMPSVSVGNTTKHAVEVTRAEWKNVIDKLAAKY